MDVLKEVKKEICPTEKEEGIFKNQIDKFLKRLQIRFKDAEVILGGSAAKGTWLRNNSDVDIFVRFNHNGKISDDVEKALYDLSPVRFHGSRDYFQVEDEYVYEVVPVVKIKNADEAKNITDASPLHTEWVKKNTNQKLRNEIRLTKQFFKAHELYGAESYIKGFSGYVLEILTIYYGSFLKLLKATKKWKVKQVIDIEKYHKDVFFEVNHSKLESPIIVIDPVQKGRNAAAALSYEKFKNLKTVAREFLKQPSKDYFTKKQLDINKLKKLKNTLVIQVFPVSGKKDIVGCKIDKVFKFIKLALEKNDFEIKEKGWEWNSHAYLYYKLKKYELPEIMKVNGPPAKIKYHSDMFKKKYKKVKKSRGRLVAEIKRKYKTPDKLIKDIKSSQYLKDKVEKVKIL